MKSSVGVSIAKAIVNDASALLEVSPTALLFGAWHSTGEGGGLGAKFARCLVSEIVAVDVPVNVRTADRKDSSFLVASGDSLQTVEAVSAGRRTGSRIDPLGILRRVGVFKSPNGWDVTEVGAGKGAKKVRPSEINHGNIAPSVAELGITCDHLDHTFVLSFAGLRRLRFGANEQKNAAGRALLAALGLLASIEQEARGYALRSRCDLIVEGSADMEIVHADGTADKMSIDRAQAHILYRPAWDLRIRI